MTSWTDSLDLGKVGDEDRYKILEYVVGKIGREKVLEVLGISRITLWRLLNRQQKVDNDKLRVLLSFVSEEEFREILSSQKVLEILGVIRSDGSINYPVVIEVLKIASRDEYLKQLILRFAVENFREDLRKMLGISFAGIKMEWNEDFEHFLMERKKRRKVKAPETLQYYKNLFMRYLEGKQLSEQLIDYVINHENKWLRNVFRHYIQYLYYKRKISPETFGWIMEVVPSRSYKLDVRPYPIDLEDVRKTLEFLREKHKMYYTIYRVMLESGARFEHVLRMIETWRPDEVVEIPGVGLETRRLVCFPDRGFCRYYMGLRGSEKPCEWIYFGLETLRLLGEVAPRHIDRHQVTRYAKRHGLILPKYLRKVAWRLMVRSTNREVARFIQSRFGELKISEARYEDLLSETDELYPRYLNLINELEKKIK